MRSGIFRVVGCDGPTWAARPESVQTRRAWDVSSKVGPQALAMHISVDVFSTRKSTTKSSGAKESKRRRTFPRTVPASFVEFSDKEAQKAQKEITGECLEKWRACSPKCCNCLRLKSLTT